MDRDSILHEAAPAQRAVYEVVRAGVDSLERAAPWAVLYYAPEDTRGLVDTVHALVNAVEEIPARVQSLLAVLPAGTPGRDGEPTPEEIGFLLDGIHEMIGVDLRRLKLLVAVASSRELSLQESLSLCEQASDLKGKYMSAMMGAAASIVGGLGAGVEIEPVLFPEKEEEFRGTRHLIEGLHNAIDAIQLLAGSSLFGELVSRWRRGERVDQYALAELPMVRVPLGRLLQERSRRALYSGDYHELSARELRLSERIGELERLHRLTWKRLGAGAIDLGPVYQDLVRITVEIAAILDAETLKSLIGEEALQRLRAQLAAGAGEERHAGEDNGLLALLAHEDLRIFLEALLGSVSRRASLSARDGTSPARARRHSPAGQAPPESAPVKPPPARPEPAASPYVWQGDQQARQRATAALKELMAASNPHWKSFSLTKRLLEKSARIPTAMYQALRPFLEEVVAKLGPDLASAAPGPGMSVAEAEELRATCEELLARDPGAARINAEVPGQLERVVLLLERFRAANSGGR